MRAMENTRRGPLTAGKARQHPALKKVATASDASSNRAKPAVLPDIVPGLAEVRLIDGRAAAQVGGMSLSWWHEKVAVGLAPQPVFRAPRCTRWRLADGVAFWRDFRPCEAGGRPASIKPSRRLPRLWRFAKLQKRERESCSRTITTAPQRRGRPRPKVTTRPGRRVSEEMKGYRTAELSVRSWRPATTALSPTAAPPDDGAAARKCFATLQARAALRGITVTRGEADSGTAMFHVSRWSFTKGLPDLAAVERFLATQGVRA